MASSNHVPMDEPLQVANGHTIFTDSELNGYNGFFSSHGGDQDIHYLDPGSFAIPRSTSAPLSQPWQTAARGQRPAFDVNHPYSRAYSESPAPYHDAPFAGHGVLHPQYQQHAVDPSLVAASVNGPSTAFDLSMRSSYPPSASQSATVSPEALQSGARPLANGASAGFAYQMPKQVVSDAPRNPTLPFVAAASVTSAPTVVPSAPKGSAAGNFTVVELEELAKATKSRRLHNFVTIGEQAVEIPVRHTTIPQYVPRRSRNEFIRLAKGDQALLAKVVKKAHKKIKVAVPKAARARALLSEKLPAMKEESSDSSTYTDSSDDESDYETSDDEPGTPVPEPSPLPAARPADPHEAVRYDTIKAVWRAYRQLPCEAASIREGLKDYWEVVRTIRDRWRADIDAVKKAEEAKKGADLPDLRKRVVRQREMLEISLKAALEYAHPNILELFGENLPFLNFLHNILIDRAKNSECNGTLAKSVLQIFGRCTTLKPDTLEKIRMDKAFRIYQKRGDDEVKSLVKKIQDNLKSEAKEESLADPKDKNVEKSVKPNPESVRRPSEPAAGVKRPRPSDSAAALPAKKPALSSAGAGSVPASAVAKAGALTPKRPAAAGAEKPSAGTPGAGIKSKGRQVVPKPTSFFQAQPAVKKPSAAAGPVAQKASASNAAVEKKAPSVPMAASRPPTFSFAEAMANLTKPKAPEPSSKPEEKRPPETEEEKAKRLRKEERRKLRVAFKPDHSLVEIRYFKHDPEEELGHDSSMVRDVADIGGEGRMFKQHKDIDMDDFDGEEDLRDWKMPSHVDFGRLDEEQRRINYEQFAGQMKLDPVNCPEKAAQEAHESNTLMVFYSLRSDIPPSPREPEQMDDQPSTPRSFGLPESESVRARILPPTPAPSASAAPDIAAILAALNPTPQAAQPSQMALPFMSTLPTTAQQSVSQPPAPAQIVPQQPVGSTGQLDNNSLMNILQRLQNQPPTEAQPQAAPTYAHAQQPAQQAQAGFDVNNFSALQFAQLLGNQAQQTASSSSPGPPQHRFEDGGQKRSRYGQHDERDNKAHKKQKLGLKYSLPCKYWPTGNCLKGEQCTYRHDTGDARR